jgi:uncharacterized damage-inducible protein DinB
MSSQAVSLAAIYDGWDGHQTSLVNAIKPLTAEQLRWRATAELQSVGELARHIALGRVTWFARMAAPGSAAVVSQITHWYTDGDGNRNVDEAAFPITEDAAQLVHWLELTWQMVEHTLAEWTVDDLAVTYRHTWNGDTYAVARQWTLWRMLTHDVHHGGQIALLLGMQGITVFELGDLFGHITLPPLAEAM